MIVSLIRSRKRLADTRVSRVEGLFETGVVRYQCMQCSPVRYSPSLQSRSNRANSRGLFPSVLVANRNECFLNACCSRWEDHVEVVSVNWREGFLAGWKDWMSLLARFCSCCQFGARNLRKAFTAGDLTIHVVRLRVEILSDGELTLS